VFWYLDIDEIIIEVPQWVSARLQPVCSIERLTRRPDTIYTTVYDNNSTSLTYDGAWLPVPEASLTSAFGASFTFP
jgi:hypothetical protein